MRNNSSKGELAALVRRLGEIDWDFTDQASQSAFSSVHWHPCRFPSQIPALAIGRLSATDELVLDPFMGSATTLVEAQRLGRQSIGIDVNPVSCLMAEAKTLKIDSSIVVQALQQFRLSLESTWSSLQRMSAPPSVQKYKWYMPSTLEGLEKTWKVCSETNSFLRPILLAAFSGILLSSCRETRHWGYVCDNTQPKSDREPDVKVLFVNALCKFERAYTERSNSESNMGAARVVHADAATWLAELNEESVDCIVTSPPYFGVADYVKAQRLTLEWLEMEIEPVRKLEIGARSKRHRKSAYSEYQDGLTAVFKEIYRVLKCGSRATVVFGQSPSREDAQTEFTANLDGLGFELELSRHRTISLGRRLKPSLARETVLVFRK